MEIQEIADVIDEVHDKLDEHDEYYGLEVLLIKLGQVADFRLQMQAIDEDDVADETVEKARGDLAAGIVIATFEYAFQHDVDLESAIENRIEYMEERIAKRNEIQQAMEDNDASALADALGVEANEVPTGDDADDRMFQ